DLRGGDVQAALARELQGEELFGIDLVLLAGDFGPGAGLTGQLAGLHQGQAGEAGDAVVGVDDVVSDLQVEEGVHGAAGAEAGGATADGETVEELVVGDVGEGSGRGGSPGGLPRPPHEAAVEIADDRFDLV